VLSALPAHHGHGMGLWGGATSREMAGSCDVTMGVFIETIEYSLGEHI